MANTIPSPNMNLPIPIATVDSGPDYANNVNASLLTIDGHTHAPGSGLQIQPSGLNISSDLSIQNNNLTNVRSLRLTSQPSVLVLATDLGILSNITGNLYWNNNGGTPVQITNGSSIVGAAGTISGLPSGTASAAYAAGTFVFQSATATSAIVDGQSFILRNNVASSKGLTLSPPSSMAANFSLVLPSIPVAQSFLTIDTSGNIAAYASISGGITGSNIAATTIAGSNLVDNTLSDTQIELQGISAASILNATLTTTQISATAGITPTQLGTPTTWSHSMSGNVTYTTGVNTPIEITSFTPSNARPVFWSFTGNTSGSTGNVVIPAGWKVNFVVQAGLTVIFNSTVDNTGSADPLAIPLSAFNGFVSSTSGGSGHTLLFGVDIITGGSGSLSVTASTMNAMQI